MKNWYSIKSMSDEVVSISIHDEIGYWGVSAKEFINELMQYPDAKSINLSVHSPGGEMIDGFAIYNVLKSHPATVHGYVEGVAASMASVILMAADTISMPENAFIMIHNPSGGAWGGSDELRHMADLMDKFKASALAIYQKRTQLPEDELSEMLDSETWMNGHEAMTKRFVDTVTDAVEVAAKVTGFDKHFKNMPIANNHADISTINNIKDFERYLRDAGGLSKGVATALASRAKAVFRSDSDNKPSEGLAEIHNAMMRMKVPESLTK